MTDALDITPATDAEREWAAKVMAASEPWLTLGRGLDECREAVHRPGYVVFVAHDRGEPCGFVLLHPRGVAGAPYLATIAVDVHHRGRGVGGRLMAFIEDYFRPTARHIFLCVSSFNRRARALYERLGYEQVGEFHDYVIDGASEILMHKWLRRS